MKMIFNYCVGRRRLMMTACTQESQNKIGRSIQNWTGTDGVLEVYAGEKLVRRFINVDKLSTAYGTSDKTRGPIASGTDIWIQT
jgi:hypothetical protein